MARSTVYTVIIHTACWLLFLSLPVLFLTGQEDRASITSKLLAPEYWVFYFIFIFLFYVNAYFLIPRLYLQKKYFYYFAVIFLLLAGVYFIRPFDRLFAAHHRNRRDEPMIRFDPEKPMLPPTFRDGDGGRDFGHRFGLPPEHDRHRPDFVSIILFGMVITLGMAIRIIQQWRLSEQRAIRAERDKANVELSFLKAQINPHFLFNTLNNIYSLAISKNDNTAPSLLKLSNIMRYVTDESTQQAVSLQSEVDCINDYIDLQRLRLSKKAAVDFTVIGSLEGKQIAPLILMTFVENAFKYGISSHQPSAVLIKLDCEAKSIVFFCQNRRFDRQPLIESTGIGIANTKERLQHLYPGQHQLAIHTDEEQFTVELTLAV